MVGETKTCGAVEFIGSALRPRLYIMNHGYFVCGREARRCQTKRVVLVLLLVVARAVCCSVARTTTFFDFLNLIGATRNGRGYLGSVSQCWVSWCSTAVRLGSIVKFELRSRRSAVFLSLFQSTNTPQRCGCWYCCRRLKHSIGHQHQPLYRGYGPNRNF